MFLSLKEIVGIDIPGIKEVKQEQHLGYRWPYQKK
jgi:hypothetical protein